MNSQVRLTVRTNQAGLVRIPLALGKAVLRKPATYEGPGEHFLTAMSEGFVLWLRGEANQSHSVTLNVSVPTMAVAGETRAQFDLPQATESSLRLTVPQAHVQARLTGGDGIVSTKDQGNGQSEVVVLGPAGSLALAWQAGSAPAASRPAALEASGEIVVKIEGEHRVTSDVRLRVRSSAGVVETVQVRLPPEMELVPVESAGYTVTPLPAAAAPADRRQGSGQVVEIKFDRPVSGIAEIRLLAEQAQSAARPLMPARFKVLGAVRERGTIDFSVEGDWNLSWKDHPSVRRLDVSADPSAAKLAARYEYSRQPCDLALTVSSRPSRMSIEPLYVIYVDDRQVRLEATLKVRMRGARAEALALELGDWKLDRLTPAELFEILPADRNASGPHVVPFRSGTVLPAELEVKLEAHRPFDPAAGEIAFTLPRALGDVVTPATVMIVPADNVELTPQNARLAGMALDPAPPVVRFPARQQPPLVYRDLGAGEAASFAAEVRVRTGWSTASARAKVQIDEQQIHVEQLLDYRIAYERRRTFDLLVPRAVIAGRPLQVLWEGEILTPTPATDAPSVSGAMRLQVATPGQQIGLCQLLVKYTLPLPKWDRQKPLSLELPLVVPADEAHQQLGGQQIEFVTSEPIILKPDPSASDEFSRPAPLAAGGPFAFAWSRVTPQSRWIIEQVEGSAAPSISLAKMWVQSWLSTEVRQDRATFRFTSDAEQLRVKLPRGTRTGSIQIAVNGQSVKAALRPPYTVVVPLPAAARGRESALELWYTIDRSSAAAGSTASGLDAPALEVATPPQRFYWQVCLPRDDYVLLLPAAYASEMRLGGGVWPIWSRPTLSQEQLETWIGASRQDRLPQSANHYLFSTFGAVPPLELAVANRRFLLGGGAVVALLVGLALLHIRVLRRPDVLLALTLALSPGSRPAGGGAARGTSGRRGPSGRAGRGAVDLVDVRPRGLDEFALEHHSPGGDALHGIPRAAAGSAAGLDNCRHCLGRRGSGAVVMNGRFLPMALAIVAAAVLAPCAWAAEPAAPLRYRRVLVPEQEVDRVVRGLLPMRRDEFDRRLRLLEAAAGTGQASSARIASATYRARLEGDALVGGQAELVITHDSTGPVLLDLAEVDLALRDARWSGAGGRAAQLGIDQAGKLGCLVEESGTLSASWSLQGQREQRGDLSFQFHLPPCPLTQMVLTLPPDLTLRAQGAIAERIAPAASRGSTTTAVARQEAHPQEVQWSILCSGNAAVTLRVTSGEGMPDAARLVLVKQRDTYTVHRGAMDVEASLDLDVLNQPISQLTLTCDSSLALVSVRQGENRLAWSELAASELTPSELTSSELTQSSGVRRIAIELSPPLVGNADAIRVTAVAPWDGEGSRRLPKIQVDGATWQEGQITVVADGSLGLRLAADDGCRASEYVAASPSQPNCTWQFQQFVPSAGIDVALADRAPALAELSATSLEFGPTQISGVYSAEVSASGGMQFALTAEIPRAWIIDSIDVQPADMLADRSLSSHPSPSPNSQMQLLNLSLRRPIVTGRPLRLTLRAHHRRPPIDEFLPPSFFSLATLKGVRDSRRLVAWQVTDPAAQLHLAGDDRLHRLDPALLQPAEMRLFDAPPRGMLFEVDQAAESLRGRLVPASGNYRLDAALHASVDHDTVREVWKLRCTPDNAAIGRLVVHCRPPTTELGEWRIAGEDPRELTVRQLESLGAAGSESVFEIALARPRQSPFDVTARFQRRRSAFQGNMSRGNMNQDLTLVSSPVAISQTGRVEIHAAPGVPLAIESDGLQTAPLDVAVTERGTLRGLFRYDPARTARLSWHVPSLERTLPLAWVESLDLVSAFLADGTGQHEAVCRFRCEGHDRLVLRLPAGATAVQAQVGEEPAVSLAPLGRDEYTLRLDSARGDVVRIRFSTRQPLADWLGSSLVQCPLPQCDWPVLTRSWQVQLPPGLALLASVLPTPPGSAAAAHAPADAGWTTFAVNLPVGETPSLRIVKRASLIAWSTCLGLAVFAVVVGYCRGQWRALALAAGLASAAWVLLPGALAAIPAGAFLGLALGAIWLLVVPRRALVTPRRGDFRASSTASLVRPAAGAGLLLATTLAASWGQSTDPPRIVREGAVSHRLVIPVNDAREPVGDYVFLEPELYDALLTRTERLAQATPDWVLTRAVYRPAITTAGKDTPLGIDEIVATLELETFRPQTSIELDFRRSEIHLVEGRPRLDGEPVVLEWTADGSKLRVPVRTQGKHRLELALGAMPQLIGERQALELTIPRAADSRLELSASASLVQVANQRGATTITNAQQGRTVDLGASGRLSLSWAKDGERGDAPLRLEAEQLLLWTIRPGSVSAAGKLRVRPLGGKVRQIAVEFDPRLRVLPSPLAGLVARQWVESAGPLNRLQMVLAEPAAGEVTVPLALLLAESSGIGSLALPRVSVQADQVERSWSAIILDDKLQWNPVPNARPGDPTADEYRAAWDEPLAGPAIAFDAKVPNLPALRTAAAAGLRHGPRID